MIVPEQETWIVVDVEADGPCPGLYSMVSFGAVPVIHPPRQDYLGRLKPLPDAAFSAEALAISGVTRREHASYPEPEDAMRQFAAWLEVHAAGRRPVFWSDNNGFDWQFVNYYFHRFLGRNPFGHSSRRIGDFAAGMKVRGWRRLRKTPHTHDPVDDARGNAEALLALMEIRAAS